MATSTATAPRFTSVFALPASEAGARYRAARENTVRAAGFPAEAGLDMHFFGGKTIEKLTFTNIYLGGKAAWNPADITNIDTSLSGAIGDPHLNNVLAQYFADGNPTGTFKPSQILEGKLAPKIYRDNIEGLVASLDAANGLSGFDLTSTVFCFMLPAGTVLVDGTSTGHAEHQGSDDGDDGGDKPKYNPALADADAADSKHGLGGYHGSVHAKHGATKNIVYYAVGVYSEGPNGIVAFDEPWKNVCATFYHELCEARTDPDVEDAIAAGDTPAANKFLGWYSDKGGEIGDIPMEEAGANLGLIMKEVKIAASSTKVPIQLMWSNAVGGPEGPIAKKHKTSPH
jgi:hypothetical protein